MTDAQGVVQRWRWTSPNADTYLYFRLPRGPFEIDLDLNPATPPENAEATRLVIDGRPVPLERHAIDARRMVLRGQVDGIRGERHDIMSELHIHTPVMLDESTLAPYAGTRQLGIALAGITVTPRSGLSATMRRVWSFAERLRP